LIFIPDITKWDLSKFKYKYAILEKCVSLLPLPNVLNILQN